MQIYELNIKQIAETLSNFIEMAFLADGKVGEEWFYWTFLMG